MHKLKMLSDLDRGRTNFSIRLLVKERSRASQTPHGMSLKGRGPLCPLTNI